MAATNSDANQKNTSLLFRHPVYHTDKDEDDDFHDAAAPLALHSSQKNGKFGNAIATATMTTQSSKNSSSSIRNSKLPERKALPLKPYSSSSRLRRPCPSSNANCAALGKENLDHSLSSIVPSSKSTLHFESSAGSASGNESGSFDFVPTSTTLSKKIEDGERFESGISLDLDDTCCLDSIESNLDFEYGNRILSASGSSMHHQLHLETTTASDKKLDEEKVFKLMNHRGESYSSNSLESRLLTSIVNPVPNRSSDLAGYSNRVEDDGEPDSHEDESCTELDVLLNLCDDDVNEQGGKSTGSGIYSSVAHHDDRSSIVHCPLCGTDISNLTHELREEHTNDCLDKEDTRNELCPNGVAQYRCPGQVVDVSPVLEWLRSLNLANYEEIFVKEEIDWDTLQWLTEEDLFNIGITALGPRKKIVHSLRELRKGSSKKAETRTNASTDVIDDTNRLAANKLITDFFHGSANHKRKDGLSNGGHEVEKSQSHPVQKKIMVKKIRDRRKLRDIPLWCCIPGTPFRVDAFKYLRRDCSHWFLTHFHIDHYQGLTRSFSHGKIYCSLITAKLVNMKIGIPWEKLQVLSLNQKINVAGIDVTCFDANHCPGSIIVLFEPPSGKAVLHTGDFRFSEEMTNMPVLQTCRIQTLILDTTYCNPQYDFPKQEAVIQFVIEAIQAEAFNQKTLFLIGSYTIGKERIFLEVARVLRQKVFVTAAKLRLLECLGIPMEDMQWFTSNEQESHIHVVPMWTLASFKRLKCISNQYARHFSLIVAFSPTGWTFGKGKKKSSGRRWQQGTIVRYEVPYSEHSSFSELKEFVKFISPENIIPSVNNDGPDSANAMVSLLSS